MAIPLLLYGCTASVEELATGKSQDRQFCLTKQLKETTTITEVTEQPILEQLTLSGKVEYNENDVVTYKSLLQGVVENVNAESGDFVHRGQVLATIRSNEIQELGQQRRALQNQISLKRLQLQSKTELLNDGLAAQPEVTALEHELKAAEIELDKINANLRLYRATGNGQFQIIAAKSGYIIRKNISAGQSVKAADDDALFSISNIKEIWVMVNIYANNMRYVQRGDLVKVKTLAFPDKIYTGRIDKIYNVFDDDEHVIKARVVLANPDLQLKPGLSADVIIEKVSNEKRAFAIPNPAKVFENNKEYVVVYKNDCHLEVRKITPIATNAHYTYVAEKFAKDEKIISSNALLLSNELNK